MNKSNSSKYVTPEEQINDQQDTLAKDGLEEKLQDSSEVTNTEVESKITSKYFKTVTKYACLHELFKFYLPIKYVFLLEL